VFLRAYARRVGQGDIADMAAISREIGDLMR
jgi:hypothetical protein